MKQYRGAKHLTRAVASLALALLLGPLTAQSAEVTFSPVDRTVVDGTTFSMDLVGLGFNSGDLDGGGIDFNYNANVVHVVSVTVDTATWEFFSDNGTIDNALGSVTGIQFNSFQPRSGDLPFATVEFAAVGIGESLLGLSEYLDNPFATGGELYPGVTFNRDGIITVTPIPGAVWLLGSALALAGWLRRARIR